MKNTFSTLALACVLSTPAISFAQFPSIPGFSKSAAAPTSDLGGQQDLLVRAYVAANKDVLTANSKMAEALGLKDAATASKATAESLTEGATKDNLNAADKEVSASTEAVAAELKKGPQLDAAAKATFGTGLLSLASGVSKYMGVGKNVSDMASGLSGASLMQLPKLQSAVTIVSKFPASMATVSSALKNAIAFAQSNDIPVPADATKALAAL
ncbi:hypothetical protein [Polaromonas sp. SM01]|uniref:hypothetical protein n=1 Tax=Polaromonas sp. SM01 TaxID=3085630 RepID=UPI002981D0FE|nr:hypothetical protein [Polaromonas sp. SM01]MDW5444219.1 hypothetical protein [Polaromonas sp. SM01]